MTLQNKTRTDIIIATFISFAFISVLVFLYEMGDDTSGKGLFFLIEVPLFPLLFLIEYLGVNCPLIVLFFAALNIALYSLLFTILFSRKLSESKRYKPFTLSYYIACAIPSMVIARIVYLILTSR